MATLNLAPLVDVLLVLLVLVITTLPAAQAIGVLPLQQRTWCPPWPYQSSPESIDLHIDAAGGMFLKGQPLDMPALQQLLAQAQQLPLPRRPAVRLSTADDTDYQDMARVLLAVSQHGLRVDALAARGGTGKTA
ncbi:biopolymer transporter ExbD [Stenotrophomonas maltophilia]|uniref:biopolymer transporter ExbD n=1 Tax=Stenotrophomonas maltophilia TaxID=40324 RepID=UPI0022F39131|nr:biopolymer transporter ExbD [Stenotrophomonas maltophilia]MDA5341861.1 biopolymer transporter ExbD [Stenotrophomonas maltophilia]